MPAGATNWQATPANITHVIANAQAGDAITMTGTFNALTIANRDWGSAGVRITAWNAIFTNTLHIKSVTGLTIRGGIYRVAPTTGRGINILSSNGVGIEIPNVVGTAGGQGIIAQRSSGVSVSGGRYRLMKLGIGYIDVSGGAISGNAFTAMNSDGINIAGSSSGISATGNSCHSFALAAGAHPDCIQMWSTAGAPQLRDITITDNVMSGPTQGITLFDLGGRNIAIRNNRIDISYPHGIACFLCDDSSITGNTLTTFAGARWQTVINAYGSNLTIADNSIGPLPLAAAGLARSAGLARVAQSNAAAAGGVPEPLVWVQLLAGFGLIGAASRQRRRCTTGAMA